MNEERWRKVEVGFTGAVAVFTLVLGIVSIGQWHVARRTLNESEKAFVYVGGIEIRPSDLNKLKPVTPNKNADIVIHLTNSGTTPARNVLTHGNVAWIQIDLDQFEFPDYPFPAYEKAGPLFIAPKQTVDIRMSIPALVVLSVREQFSPLTVWGHIEYRDDVLHDRHRTWFCQNFLSRGSDPIVSEGDVFAPCYRHNCSDDDCAEPSDFTFPTAQPMTANVEIVVPNALLASPTPIPTPGSQKQTRRGLGGGGVTNQRH